MEEPLKYSQNFIKNKKLIKKILDKTNINQNDLVLEIGPGKGIITEELSRRYKEIIAIEKDRKLYQFLKYKLRNRRNIKLVLADFLEYNLPDRKYKVFANIPFNITSEIIKKLTNQKQLLESAYLIIQKEAAQKLAGFPYTKKNQLFSLILKPWFKIEIIYSFKKNDFEPTPNIDIVLLSITKREESLVKKDQKYLYQDFISYGFTQWKPNVKNVLSKIFTYPQIKQLSGELGFSLKSKPTDIKFEQWLSLFNSFLVLSKNKIYLIKGSRNNLKKQQNKLEKMHQTNIRRMKN